MERKEGHAPGSAGDPSRAGRRLYEIRVQGQLNSRWSEWLEGLELKSSENGETTLSGPIVDQAALMGILNKLSRLNLALLSLNEVNEEGLEESIGKQPTDPHGKT